ncbi:MAG: methyltransferase domain-containing protein [Candidatus Pacebacteria bacterium]|nr:methyltransferase domain-containing protein [Candidatus Paceibacterota bacterium]
MSVLNRIRHAVRDLFWYPVYIDSDSTYNRYWSQRDMFATLNGFQADRVRMIDATLRDGDSVLDIGCGDGRILSELLKRRDITALGIDSSEDALGVAQQRGVPVQRVDIRKLDPDAIGTYDWVLLLEVLEHMSNCEELLECARVHARKAVIFSVPNTGYITHRLRLLFGRFPLQWRAHPGEHVRFWTYRDMQYWLASLDYEQDIRPYQGIPILRRIWPSLFAAGLFIVVRSRS